MIDALLEAVCIGFNHAHVSSSIHCQVSFSYHREWCCLAGMHSVIIFALGCVQDFMIESLEHCHVRPCVKLMLPVSNGMRELGEISCHCARKNIRINSNSSIFCMLSKQGNDDYIIDLIRSHACLSKNNLYTAIHIDIILLNCQEFMHEYNSAVKSIDASLHWHHAL